MKRIALPIVSKKSSSNPLEYDSSSTDRHDITATTSTSSVNHSRIKDLPSKKHSSRSIINCQSLSNFSDLRRAEFNPSEFEIAPIKENNQETSYEEEDSLILELAEFLNKSDKVSAQPKLSKPIIPKRNLSKKLSQPTFRIKIDSNNMKTARKRTTNIGNEGFTQLFNKSERSRRGAM
ncbi:unnamed protein product [Blepharisma stoltei]|uniref:Uncharacterized protein n=1 Tax=Blepharisma stoltei TaxID=1481888 RepID=A0AAU9K4R1_9CILI|nr:unnamed protein product [Blepharisma stoltei]